MKNILLKAAMMSGVLFSTSSYAQTTLYGITDANQMFTVNANTPSSASGPYTISGISSGQTMISLASRPSNGGLYGLGYDSTSHTSQLYLITNSGASYTASAVGSSTTGLNLGLSNNAAFDFVSTNDNQIRVIGRNGNNYIMNANDGSVSSTGTGSLSFASGDIYSGSSANLLATAYTNHFYGSDATDEVGYDATNNVLVKMDAGNYSNSFNNASDNMHSIGLGTGLLLDATSSVGMDIWYDTASHTNTIYMTGKSLLGGAHLYKYNMDGTGGLTMTDIGAIGSGSFNVRDIAFQSVSRDSNATITGRLMAGLSLNARNIIYFDSYNPRNIRKVVTLNGMASGQSMIGIDYASSGTLYGIGYNSGSKNYQLYTIDSVTGSVTAINSTPYSLDLGSDDGSGNYINSGFRFIPTDNNRIRVVGNNGTVNIQISATTGAIVETDSSMRYVTGDGSFGTSPDITSIAYTGYTGDSSSQLFGYDANSGAMVAFDAEDNTSGAGNGTSGYINTNLSLSTTLSLFAHSSSYNNAYMNIMYDQSTSSNLGFMAANYNGDSSAEQANYSVLYDMSDMLTGYHRGTSSAPTQTGEIGYGIPVKDIAIRRAYTAESVPTVASTSTNDLLVYPNPVLSSTRVILPDASTGNVSVDIIDMNGRVERSYQFAMGAYQVDMDMSTLPTGLYSVRIIGDGVGYHNLKIVKE